jgi:hypothetical protein
MTGPQLAVRVRKARAYGIRPFCTDRILRGHKIAKIPGRAWAHAICVVERNRHASQPPNQTETVPAE